ncbi:MAG TPA: lysylphosphatidylglycerol synthase transmembrane domain-containing protein [Chitinophagaceae bacterium]|nr:lysylphosphatidylglycerol synthase transmembrane domain-containing protein [Chitinophagaceae bacterium]
MTVKKKLRTILQYCFFLGLGIFLVWWSVKDLKSNDKSQIKIALQNARYWLIIPVFAILFFSHYIRALRWKLLIEPLGYTPRTTNTVFAVFIGYLANQAVPRLGEVLKCTILTRYEKIPADKLIGTIILERVIDALTLLLVFGGTLIMRPDLYSNLIDTIFYSSDPGEKQHKHIPSYVIIALLVIVIIIAIAAWMITKKKTFADVKLLLKRIWRSIWQGITAIRHLKKRKKFILLTLGLWIAYLSGGYLGFMAFKETTIYGIPEAFGVLSAGSIGMIITPGGIGAYAYLIQKTMEVYGLNNGVALAFGWILWLAQTTVILLGGLISFVAIPYYNRKKKLVETF